MKRNIKFIYISALCQANEWTDNIPIRLRKIHMYSYQFVSRLGKLSKHINNIVYYYYCLHFCFNLFFSFACLQ